MSGVNTSTTDIRTDGVRVEEAQQTVSEPASRGTNQSGVRAYNERLILSLIRRNGLLSKIEITTMTGLSAQTVSGIVNVLEQNGLLLRDAPLRGRVGQPTIPFRLNPEGSYSLGLKLGRRSSDLVLTNFVGEVQLLKKLTYAYPTPETVVNFVRSYAAWIEDNLPEQQRGKIVGLGIAAPFELWNWETEAGAPRDILDGWRSVDIQAEIAAVSPWPVTYCNDASAACGAELIFGGGWKHSSYIYFFIGSFIGGGVVLDGNLYQGRNGYAGAIGPLPVAISKPDGGFSHEQIIRHASTYVLENKLREKGIDPSPIWLSPSRWEGFGEVLEEWIQDVAQHLAYAIVSAVSFIDFEAAIIDGAVPLDVKRRIVALTQRRLNDFDLQGTASFAVEEGVVGAHARAIGGAALPFFENFARDRSVMFRPDIIRNA